MSPTLHHPARHRGFSLIELLTVVAIVGIVLAVALPKLRVSEATEVQLAAMQLAQDLDFARTRALSTRSRVRFQFETGAPSRYAAYLDVDMDSLIAGTAGEQLAMRGFGERELPKRIRYGRGASSPYPGDAGGGAISFDGNRAEFDPRGLVTPFGASGAVYLQHETKPQEVAAIAVSAAGGVRMWIFHDGSWK